MVSWKRQNDQCLKAAYVVVLFALLALNSQALSAQAVYADNQIPANGVQIEYRIRIEAPNVPLYEVEINIRGIREDSVRVSMPAWAPGDYRIRDFARNVQNFEAETRSGRRSLNWQKTDKQTWEIRKQPAADVIVTYELYSERLTFEMADISGPATYMYVVGHKHVPVALRYDKPRSWDVYTGLERRGGAYRAPDYDVFIDAPAFVGEFKVLEFTSQETPYRLVFSDPDVEFNEEQVLGDIQGIVGAGVEIFGSVPYENYTFLFKVRPTPGSAGLEHLNSTRITVGQNDFSSGARYQRFLHVIAHEFFHAWNVKRIRPVALGPFDYTREVYTRLLWVSEGLTSYYGRLLLLRSGILGAREYLNQLGQEINLFQHRPGRLVMSAEEASWNAWFTSDNRDNNTISYFTKGEIIGFLLDIEIRARTNNEKSLDDVMRYLMENYADKGIGFPEEGFLEALNSINGSDFGEFYATTIQQRSDLDYNRYAHQAGIQVRPRRQVSTLYMGVVVDEAEGNLARISRVLPDSPAEEAGFNREDLLLAFEDRRITFSNFEGEFRRRKLGETIEVTVARGQDILRLELTPGEIQLETWIISETPGPTPEQLELRRRWIGNLN